MSDKKITLTVSELIEFGNKCWWEGRKNWPENPKRKDVIKIVKHVAEEEGLFNLENEGTIYFDGPKRDGAFYFKLRNELSDVILDSADQIGPEADVAAEAIIRELEKEGLL